MNGDTLCLDGISRLKRLFLIRSLNRVLWAASASFLCIYTLAAAMGKMGFIPVEKHAAFYIIVAAICLAFFLFYGYFKRESISNLLIEIDGRLGLKDRLSTAYEYHKLGKRSVFADLLIADAGQRLSRLSKKEIFPPRLSGVQLLFGILMLINIFIALIEFLPHDPKQNPMDPEMLRQMKIMLKTYASDQEKDVKNIKGTGTDRIEKITEDIAKMLDDRSINRDKLHTSLNRMLKEIQSEKMLLAKTLAERLDAENIEDVFARKIPQLTTLSRYHLEKLKKMIDRLFDNQIPDAIAGDIAILDEHHSFEKFIDRIIGHLDKTESHPLDTDDSRSGTSDHFPGRKNDPAKSNRYSREKAGNRSQAGDEKGRYGMHDPVNSGQGENAGDDLAAEEDDDEPADGSSSAGHGKSDNQTKSPYGPEKVEGPAVQDKTVSSQKQEYSIQIRSLTAIGKATVKKEDIVRPYRQELESILQKEDIPLNYREYIKNYFLSIGLRKADYERNRTRSDPIQ